MGFGRGYRCFSYPNKREAGFGDVATGIGILYMARGFGSGFGPIVSRRFMSNDRLVPYLLGVLIIKRSLLHGSSGF